VWTTPEGPRRTPAIGAAVDVERLAKHVKDAMGTDIAIGPLAAYVTTLAPMGAADASASVDASP
jgi:hypothetical protein